MNGATEHTLAELLRVAQEQNANLANLNQLLSGRSSGGGGGGGGVGAGIADMGKNVPILSAAFTVAGAAVSAIGTVFEMLGNVIGKMVDGVGSAIKGLWNFSQKAMEGTARMSDLFDAFGKLPFFIGELFQIGASLLRTLEKLVDEYVEMSKIGAGFSGGLLEMRNMASDLALSFSDLKNITSKNSETFAAAGVSVQQGFSKFTNGLRQLMATDELYRLGVNSKEAAEYLTTMMKVQQVGLRNGQIDSASLSKMTRDYIIQLDELSRATGIHRDQLNESMKKNADDQVFQNWLDDIVDPDKRKDIEASVAASTARLGKDFTENVFKPILRGIDGPINDAAIKIAQASGGLSVEMAGELRRITLDSTLSAAERQRQLFLIFAKIGSGAKQFADSLDVISAADPTIVWQEGVKLGRLVKDGASQQWKYIQQEQENSKAAAEESARLLKAQETITKLGNAMTLVFAQIAIEWGPKLLDIGEWILKHLISAIATFANWMEKTGMPILNDLWGKAEKIWTDAVKIFEEYVLPKLKKIGAWFVETWDSLVSAKTPKEFFERLGDRFRDGLNNIWADMQSLWATVKPVFLKIWDEDLKPALLAAFNAVTDWLISGMRKNSRIARFLFNETDSEREQSDREELARLRKEQKNLRSLANSSPDTGFMGELGAYMGNQDEAREKLARLTELENKYGSNVDLSRPQHYGARAGGGLVNPGTYLVGERGPELLSVGASGNVITNENLQKLLNRLAGDSDNNYLAAAVEELNNTMKRMETHAATTADYSRRTVGAIAQMGGDIMPAI